MERPPETASPRSGRATPIVLLLLLAVAAAGYRALVPDFRRAREAVRVERAARAVRACDAAARAFVAEEFVGSVAEVTLDMVDEYRRSVYLDPLVWPVEADLSTLDFSDTNGVTVVVRLRDGSRRISAADLARPAETEKTGEGR